MKEMTLEEKNLIKMEMFCELASAVAALLEVAREQSATDTRLDEADACLRRADALFDNMYPGFRGGEKP